MPPAPRLVRYKGQFAVQWYDERAVIALCLVRTIGPKQIAD